MNDDVLDLDATAQAALVRSRQVTVDELLDAARARIERVNPALNAIVTEIEPQPGPVPTGPFAGVPFLVKDLGREVGGTRLTNGSRWLSENVSRQDQELVRRYQLAGLVLLGKTNTSEFGLSLACEPALFGPTRNPWDPSRSTGGSSGGSAAAVAAGLVPMAHASDLGGSIRYPAAWCGVFGLKPTRGRVPLDPTFGDVASALLAEHVVTRSVPDSAALLDAVAGPATGDLSRPLGAEVGAPPGRLRIAATGQPRHGQHLDPGYGRAFENATMALEDLGHDVVEASPGGLDDEYETALRTVYRAAAGWIVEHWTQDIGRPPGPADVEPLTRQYWDAGRDVTAEQQALAFEVLGRTARRTAAFLDSHDLWVTPTMGGPPPLIGELGRSRRPGEFLMFDGELANVTGNPAMSVPFGVDDGGLPFAIHVLGPFGREARMIRLASQLEAAHPWGQASGRLATMVRTS